MVYTSLDRKCFPGRLRGSLTRQAGGGSFYFRKYVPKLLRSLFLHAHGVWRCWGGGSLPAREWYHYAGRAQVARRLRGRQLGGIPVATAVAIEMQPCLEPEAVYEGPGGTIAASTPAVDDRFSSHGRGRSALGVRAEKKGEREVAVYIIRYVHIDLCLIHMYLSCKWPC